MHKNKELLILSIIFILGSNSCSKDAVTCFYCESPTIRITKVKDGNKTCIDVSLKEDVSCKDSAKIKCYSYYYDTIYYDTLNFLIFKETECIFNENLPPISVNNLATFFYSSYCKKK